MPDLRVGDRAPEFHVVVRRNTGRGPLAPYRLALAVVFALVITGNDLLDAAATGIGIDVALLRATTAASFIWVLAGIVSRILASAHHPSPPPPAP